MKLFADTGNVKELEALASLGILDGVTTNPSLMAKEGGDPRKILKQICALVQGPVAAAVVDLNKAVDGISDSKPLFRVVDPTAADPRIPAPGKDGKRLYGVCGRAGRAVATLRRTGRVGGRIAR